jgi:hypothetical protein
MSASTVCRKHAALFPFWSLTWPTARNFHWWLPSKQRYDGDASDGVCSGVGGKGAMAQAVTAQGRLDWICMLRAAQKSRLQAAANPRLWQPPLTLTE